MKDEDNTPDDILTTVHDRGLNTPNKIEKKTEDQQFLTLNNFNISVHKVKTYLQQK